MESRLIDGHPSASVRPQREAVFAPAESETGDVLMSQEQQIQLDAILRQGRLDTAGEVQALRAAFNELMARVPVPPDVQQRSVEIGGVSGIEVSVDGNESENV